MNMDAPNFYSALRSRDARFDGRFFTGVVTTGVYCRPVCPAPPPRPENCRFFPSAAAAERAGFRPCLRCHPESSPGTPAWQGASATVARALRLISDGALDENGVDELASRLGVGARHLRRLFLQHLGAAPLAVAQTRRLQLAKQLLDETRLPVIRVAEAAGFRSLRRFNAAVLATYGRSPRDLRRQADHGAASAGTTLTLTLAYRPPYDWGALTEYLKGRAIPSVESISAGGYRRTFQLDGATGVLEVLPVPGRHLLRLRIPAAASRHLVSVVARVRRMFDLEADPAAIAAALARDPGLTPLVSARPGLRVPGAWDGFELAVRAVLGQQVSVAAATTLSGRLVRAYGEPVLEAPPDGPERLFPTPARLAGAELAGIGLTRARAETIRELARAVRDGKVHLNGSADPEELAAQLLQIPGIGQWTVDYILLRGLREPDAFPAGDLGLRRAAAESFRPLPEKRLRELSEKWRPWRAYAAMHLWIHGPGGLKGDR
jgi:AraC family transcriptional regulator of adaptative response / DNA-3-methyladenine glycosylase II